jgi:hypothetical protein
MDSKRKVSQAFDNNPQGSRLRTTKNQMVEMTANILIKAKLKTGRTGKRNN